MTIELNMIQTLAIAIGAYFLGSFLKNKISILEKFCIPSPVIGGLIFAIFTLILRQTNIAVVNLDTTLQDPFMLVFFTTIGLGASFKMIKEGGKKVILFFISALTLVILQDILGISISKAIGADPLLGLIAGSVTMTGGHGTGVTWGALFETNYGLAGASTIAMASATFGLICGSLLGGPIGRKLIMKNKLECNNSNLNLDSDEAVIDVIETDDNDIMDTKSLFNTLSIIFIAMGLGTVLEKVFTSFGITLPSYIDAMIIACIIVNVGESTGKFKINTKCTDTLGSIGLNVFLSMALISLKLWELQEVAGPLVILLAGQAILMGFFSYFITYRLMGKDYDAAVIAAGHCGFGMGATPNAMANMDAVTSKFGPSPTAYFVLPVVGAFLIDFSNSLIITFFTNIL